MEKELDYEEALDAGVSISLRKNPLSRDGTLIPQVSARKATIDMVLTALKAEVSNLDASLMRYHLTLYQDKLLELLKMGYDVKVLDLGALHIKAKGLVRSAADAAELSDFTVRFTPTKKTLDAVKGLSVDVASVPNRAPLIESVTDLYRGEADGAVTAGQAASLLGRRLKLSEGEDNFIAFVPQDSSGRDIEDKAEWLFAERDKVFRNMPRELCFYAPEGLEAGAKYRIRVSTTFASTRVARKAALCGMSEAVTALNS